MVFVEVAVIEVKLLDTDASRGMFLNHALKEMGYVNGKHYDFKYVATMWDPMSGHLVENKHVIFMFHDEHESIASWFKLKYG